jgi:ribosomal protein S15P/S13E
MKKHSRAASISDTETLVGSESPKSPISPWLSDFGSNHIDDDSDFDEVEDLKMFDNDMALQKCMELLSSELSTALAESQPIDQVRQSSGLQILLMIESYERVQQHLRQQIYNSHAKTGQKDRIQDVERILEYWLKVLYSVYDRSYENSKQGNEEYFPPPLSVKSSKKPPKRSIHRKPLPQVPHVGFMDVRI